METQSPPLLFEGPTARSVILQACAAHGPDVRLSAPERVRSRGIGGFFAKTTYRVRVIPDDAAPLPVADGKEVGRIAKLDPIEQMLASSPDVSFSLSKDQPDDFAKALTRAVHALGDNALGARVGTPAPVAPAGVAGEPESVADDGFDWDALLREQSTSVIGQARMAREGGACTSADVLADAQRAGVPASVIARAAAAEGGASLVELMRALPAAPPLTRVAGSLVAVVGVAPGALEAARTIARRLHQPIEEVAIALCGFRRSKHARDALAQSVAVEALAPDLLVQNPRDAAAFAPGWRRDRVGIVALILGDAPNALAQTRLILAALRPSVVYAIQPAAAKPEDAAVFLRGIGGADALHLKGCQATFTPAAICSLGLPVAFLDSKEATPERWAMILEDAIERRKHAERIADAS